MIKVVWNLQIIIIVAGAIVVVVENWRFYRRWLVAVCAADLLVEVIDVQKVDAVAILLLMLLIL